MSIFEDAAFKVPVITSAADDTVKYIFLNYYYFYYFFFFQRKTDSISCESADDLYEISSLISYSTHNQCFDQKYEKYQTFYLKIFIMWWKNFQYIWIGVFS